MPINVRAPDGSLVSFPDGTGAATIDGVISQHFGPQSAPQGRGMFDDLIPRRGGVSLAPSPVAGRVVRKGGPIFDFGGPQPHAVGLAAGAPECCDRCEYIEPTTAAGPILTASMSSERTTVASHAAAIPNVEAT